MCRGIIRLSRVSTAAMEEYKEVNLALVKTQLNASGMQNHVTQRRIPECARQVVDCVATTTSKTEELKWPAMVMKTVEGMTK